MRRATRTAALAQQAQPLTDVDLRQIIQCIDDGEPIDPDDTKKLAQMVRDRMAQQAQRTDDYACRHNVKARECKICSPENKF